MFKKIKLPKAIIESYTSTVIYKKPNKYIKYIKKELLAVRINLLLISGYKEETNIIKYLLKGS